MSMTKFVQSLNPDVYSELTQIAKERGITVQALIRQVMGEWALVERQKKKE